MQIFDVHTHMQDKRYIKGYDSVLKRAVKNSVVKMMCCGLHEYDWDQVLDITNEAPEIYPAFGIHPWFVEDRSSNWLDILEEKLLATTASVGEIGIDKVVLNSKKEENTQEMVFTEQLKLAKKLNRPVNIHCRNAWGKLIEIIDNTGLPDRGGLVHSYSGSHEMVKVLEKRGLMISFSGSVTKINNKKARKAVLSVSDKMLLIETDSPDINPEGITGLNEPKYILKNLETIAELRGKSMEEIASITFENSLRLFD
ncbi:MAG: TatD family hydrolase [Desulfobacterales bacterium]|nr:TatD family hydrolase [Desulfobacterales bacterium]MCP4163925.1 TatD family hydrolase [Deltaproteobacteria bacterium]